MSCTPRHIYSRLGCSEAPNSFLFACSLQLGMESSSLVWTTQQLETQRTRTRQIDELERKKKFLSKHRKTLWSSPSFVCDQTAMYFYFFGYFRIFPEEEWTLSASQRERLEWGNVVKKVSLDLKCIIHKTLNVCNSIYPERCDGVVVVVLNLTINMPNEICINVCTFWSHRTSKLYFFFVTQLRSSYTAANECLEPSKLSLF